MKPLSDKEFREIQSKMHSKGVTNVFDAQNRKGVLRKARGIKIKQKPMVVDDSIKDPVLEKLSMSEEEIKKLINELNGKNDNTKIEDIDWKKVRSI